MLELFGMTKFDSITSPGIKHDEPNILTEFIFLNKNPKCEKLVWRGHGKKEWGQIVSCIRMMMKRFKLSSDQIAFYIFYCRPTKLDSDEIAKLAVVAKKLFRKYSLPELYFSYQRRFTEATAEALDSIAYKPLTEKSFMQFIKELENNG